MRLPTGSTTYSEATTIRKIFAALLCVSLLFPIVATAPAATATYGGDCPRAYARFWENYNFTGASVKYCWYGVNNGDTNMSSYDSTPNLGPLYNGNYAFDFEPSDFLSGIDAVTFYTNPNDGLTSNLCLYWSRNFETPATRLYASGNYSAIAVGDIQSMKWTQVSSVNDC